MPLLSIVVALVVVGLLLWAVGKIPVDPTIAKIIRVLVVVVACLWLLQALGLFTGGPVIRLR
jgi:hypothetical protein